MSRTALPAALRLPVAVGYNSPVMTNIWQQLTKPIFTLAPMEEVTDTVFRQIVARAGAPHLFFTEFTWVDGMMTRARPSISRRFIHTPAEQPLIAQIWGTNPDNFFTVARQLAGGEFGPFAGIDLNMGCPERKIVKRGACAGLIDHRDRAVAIIQATKAGAGALPVSVKTRCGTESWVTEEWAELLLRQDLAALTIHGRIASERSDFPARWDEIAKVAALRDRLGVATVVIGNGDVTSYRDGLDKAARSGVDGVMVGRGIFGNLWLFNPDLDPTSVPLRDRLLLLAEHLQLWQETWGDRKYFGSLKKLYKTYLVGLPATEPFQRELLLLQSLDVTLARVRAEIEVAGA
jgi:tRNA-dihydrouridine synthase